MTTTAQNAKILPNSPTMKSPGNTPSPQTLGEIAQKSAETAHLPPLSSKKQINKNPSTGKSSETSPSCAINK